MSTVATACPRCGEPVLRGQEYCLECGVRLGRRLPGDRPTSARPVQMRIAALALLAVAGATAGIVATRDTTTTEQIVTALGGSVPVAQPKPSPEALVTWPSHRKGWTVVLVSVPKVDGRDKAVALAQHARDAKLDNIGVIDSSGFASLRPGYWVVFQGVYESEAEANGALREARRASKAARVQVVSP